MKLVYVKKYGDAIPVQLRQQDPESHVEALAQLHGEGAIVLEDGRTLLEVRQPEREAAAAAAAAEAEAERVRLEQEAAAAAEAEAARIAAEEEAKKAGGGA